MIKSLIRWSAAASIFAATVLGTGGNQFKALALPNEQILEILNPVPVFTIANKEGQPITVTRQVPNEEASGENKEQTLLYVFMSPKDAENYIETVVKEQNAELATDAVVVTLPLGYIFEESQKEENQQKGLLFTFIPTQQSQTAAQGILEGEEQQYEGGVPLFWIKDKESGQPIPSFENEDTANPILRLFFEKDRLDNAIKESVQDDVDFDANFKIEVTLLEQIIGALVQKDDEYLQKIRFVISDESQEFILQNAANAPAPAGENQQ
ncbi:Tic22-like family [Xenococcus sp. PCC 7305]|uniref:Tic22 family protein n=1 Tax=Xenococcus sp. PCC 7305 TaxID=102125 RepID=UPI0002AD09C1|nr:Tic22 family protein [Xenococcus sp. PCC 7305]ELS04187.1 Tic22-like family [Xenococcus sp. PCC 7305]